MEDEKELKELLVLLNQQSLRISELEKEKSDLISNLQKKDSQLSESISIAERMKAQVEQLNRLQDQNKYLRESLDLSKARMNARIADIKKEYDIKQSQLKIESKDHIESADNKVSSPIRSYMVIVIGILLLENLLLFIWWLAR